MINLPVLATLGLTFQEIFLDGFDHVEKYVWYGAVGLMVYLTIGANYNMVRCETTDPGILPARRWPGHTDKKYGKADKQARDYYTKVNFVSLRAAPHLFSFTYCKSCQIWQPQRTNHCPICQTCVLQLDHHCHWLGTCLGARNYHLFYWYLFHLVLLCVCQLIYTGLYLWRVYAVRSDSETNDDGE